MFLRSKYIDVALIGTNTHANRNEMHYTAHETYMQLKNQVMINSQTYSAILCTVYLKPTIRSTVEWIS